VSQPSSFGALRATATSRIPIGTWLLSFAGKAFLTGYLKNRSHDRDRSPHPESELVLTLLVGLGGFDRHCRYLRTISGMNAPYELFCAFDRNKPHHQPVRVRRSRLMGAFPHISSSLSRTCPPHLKNITLRIPLPSISIDIPASRSTYICAG
jgi:hypothetical protein